MTYDNLKSIHDAKAKEFRDGVITQDDYYRWLRNMEYTEQEAMSEIILQQNERQVLGEYAQGSIVKVMKIVDGKPVQRMATIRTILGDGAVCELGTGGFVTAKFVNVVLASEDEIQRFANDRAMLDEARMQYDDNALERFKKENGL